MINFDNYPNENKTEHNPKWPYIPDHPYRILIVGGSGSGKTNALLNLINNQPDINKMYLYAKDPFEAKYQYLINKCEKVGLDHFKGCARYIFASLFLSLNKSTCHNRKNVFYFTSKALFVLEKIKF